MAEEHAQLIATTASLRRDRAKAERNRDRWQAKLDKIDDELRAFEKVLQVMGVEYPDDSSRGMKDAVVAALDDFVGRTVKPSDVVEAIRSDFPTASRSYASRVLIELYKEGRIEQTLQGRGRQQSEYFIPNQDESEDEAEGASVTPIRRASGES
jgi:NADH:ubiquinone oxidoreductase subunit C